MLFYMALQEEEKYKYSEHEMFPYFIDQFLKVLRFFFYMHQSEALFSWNFFFDLIEAQMYFFQGKSV